jgi:hypothetical protein
MWLIALASAALLTVQSSPAAPAPLVFDFEDGLQGWALHGATARVQTQLLGGQWAIFGDGPADPPVLGANLIENVFIPRLEGTHISITADLTGIRLVSLEQFLVDGDGIGPSLLLLDLIENIFIFNLLPFEPEGPGNPNVWTVDVSSTPEVEEVFILWSSPGDPAVPIVAFIDNITFHPVPEAASVLLLGLGLIGLAAARTRSGLLQQ